MIIHKFSQHKIADEQVGGIKIMVDNWKNLSHQERTSFIDSINVYTNPNWLDVRVGKFTASTAAKFLADPKSKEDKESGKIGESAKTLCHKVLAEQAGWREQQNPYMEYASIRRGLVFEDVARKLAEKNLEKQLQNVAL